MMLLRTLVQLYLQEVDVEVSGTDWTCKGIIALVSLPGPGQDWKLDLADM